MSDESEYYKWRTLIAMAHVDKRFMREEQQFLRDKIQNDAPPAMSSQLMQEMAEDMLNPKPPDMLFDRIAQPQDKVQALILSHELFWADGDMDDSEEDIFRFMLKSIRDVPSASEALDQEMQNWDVSDPKLDALKNLIESV